ncbi:hypothetical protein C359_05675 [Cryptococcus neoformans Bt120]|nr:hypothetical protein C359_05675 [Cryptococcus neoformans var. grubii Bt120]
MLTTSSGPVRYMSQQYEKDDPVASFHLLDLPTSKSRIAAWGNAFIYSKATPFISPSALRADSSFPCFPVSSTRSSLFPNASSHGSPSLPLAFLLLPSTPNYLPVFLSSSTSSSPYPRSLHWVSVQEVPMPELGDNQVLVKVEYAALESKIVSDKKVQLDLRDKNWTSSGPPAGPQGI